MASKKISVIIPAAGISSRFALPVKKQHIELNEIPLLNYCIKIFNDNSGISEIIVVTNPDDIEQVSNQLKQFQKVKKVVAGGNERHFSVKNGFNSASENTDIILVHDAARPFVSDIIIERILNELIDHDAVICGIPIHDTVKEVENSQHFINQTFPRDKLWRAQTPQGFKYDLLKKIYNSIELKDIIPTDESQLAEFFGAKIKIVEGSVYNIKITDLNDFMIAESYIKNGLI